MPSIVAKAFLPSLAMVRVQGQLHLGLVPKDCSHTLQRSWAAKQERRSPSGTWQLLLKKGKAENCPRNCPNPHRMLLLQKAQLHS